jgi:hypothetical protein
MKLKVNYDQTIEELIKKGKYDWVNSDITENNFPDYIGGQIKLEAELVKFDKYMESDDILMELDKQGLRPATLKELLSFGIQYPDEKKEEPIVALGSVVDLSGYRLVPVLFRWHGERGLGLRFWGGGWHGRCRFLAFRKSLKSLGTLDPLPNEITINGQVFRKVEND